MSQWKDWIELGCSPLLQWPTFGQTSMHVRSQRSLDTVSNDDSCISASIVVMPIISISQLAGASLSCRNRRWYSIVFPPQQIGHRLLVAYICGVLSRLSSASSSIADVLISTVVAT